MSQSPSRSLLSSFSASCETLQCVRADHCENVTDHDVALLLQRCKALQRLSVRGCSQLTDKVSSVRCCCCCPLTRKQPGHHQGPAREIVPADARSSGLQGLHGQGLVQDCRFPAPPPPLLSLSLSLKTHRSKLPNAVGLVAGGSGLQPGVSSSSVDVCWCFLRQQSQTSVTAVLDACTNLQSLAIPLCTVNEQSLLLIRNTSCHVRALDIFGSKFKVVDFLLLLPGSLLLTRWISRRRRCSSWCVRRPFTFRALNHARSLATCSATCSASTCLGYEWPGSRCSIHHDGRPFFPPHTPQIKSLTLPVMKFICKRSPGLQVGRPTLIGCLERCSRAAAFKGLSLKGHLVCLTGAWVSDGATLLIPFWFADEYLDVIADNLHELRSLGEWDVCGSFSAQLRTRSWSVQGHHQRRHSPRCARCAGAVRFLC